MDTFSISVETSYLSLSRASISFSSKILQGEANSYEKTPLKILSMNNPYVYNTCDTQKSLFISL